MTEDALRQNMLKQCEWAVETTRLLRENGISEEKEISVEYFFYTNKEEKAKGLFEELMMLGYKGEIGLAPPDGKQFVITGWTTGMKTGIEPISGWIKEMCMTGYKHDCDFDGWGTNV